MQYSSNILIMSCTCLIQNIVFVRDDWMIEWELKEPGCLFSILSEHKSSIPMNTRFVTYLQLLANSSQWHAILLDLIGVCHLMTNYNSQNRTIFSEFGNINSPYIRHVILVLDWSWKHWKPYTIRIHFNSPQCRIYATMNWVSTGSGNGLSPVRHQAITRTNAGIFSIGLLGANINENRIKIQNFSFMKMHLKMSSAKWRSLFPRGRWVKTGVKWTP